MMAGSNGSGAETRRWSRAPRFDIRFPLRYRPLGQDTWWEGVTTNVSASGVLFVADVELEPDTPVQMTLVLPVQVAGDATGRVFCQGRIARVVGGDAPALSLTMAATIASYRFLRPEEESYVRPRAGTP